MSLLDRFSNFTLVCVIAITIALRFVALESSPPGFYLDEAANATNVLCIADAGTDQAGTSFPILARSLGGGFTSAPYLYLGAAWTKIFGDSIWSLRALAALFSSLTILGLYRLAFVIAGKEAALFSALAGAISPWSFQFSRIAWDPPIMPCFLIWGCYLLIKGGRYLNYVLAGAFMAVALYAYPPARVAIPILLPSALFLSIQRSGLSKAAVKLVIFALTLTVISTPLISLTLSGDIQGRYQTLSIFSPHSGKGPNVFVEYLQNFSKHFTPDYLLGSGDSNLRHSTRSFGILSWVEGLAILLGIIFPLIGSYRDRKAPIIFAMVGIIAGITPAALTWEGIPHSLRSIGAQPFFALLTGIVLAQAYQRWKVISYYTAVVSIAFSLWFFPYYLRSYPKISAAWFNDDLVKRVREYKTSEQWESLSSLTGNYDQMVLRYFMMAYGGYGCAESRGIATKVIEAP